MLRILYLNQLLPYPPDAGPKVRSYHVVQHLAGRHEVTLAAFSRPSDRPESLAHLRSFCSEVHTVPMPRSTVLNGWHLARALLTNQPFLITRDHVPAMIRLLRRLVQEAAAAGRPYDAVHADQLWMAPYALAAGQSAPAASRPRLVLDQHNAVFLIPQRLAQHEANPLKRLLLQREQRRMQAFEVAICRRFDHVVWVTAEDQAAVQQAAPAAALPPATVIPICVDPRAKPVLPRRPGAQRVTFLGGLHWPPNAAGLRWFFQECWPRVRRESPEAVLTVIGRDPPAEIAAAPRDHLDVTGYVDDPTPYLQETAAFIVPLHAGGGMRVKIVDAWSWGLPVASTTIGAEGLAYTAEENLLIGNGGEEFAAAVGRLLQDPELGRRLGAAGRRTVEQHYDWRVVYRAFDQVYAPGLPPRPSLEGSVPRG